MIVSEIIFDQISVMSYVLMKYIVGTLHTMFTPVTVLFSYPQVSINDIVEWTWTWNQWMADIMNLLYNSPPPSRNYRIGS